jgi:Flp pilus assembly protein TadD
MNSSDPTMSTEGALRDAVGHHRAGNLDAAERLYRMVLQRQPGQPDANHNLGMIALQSGRPSEGLRYLQAAVETRPAEGQYWISLISALAQTGQSEQARIQLNRAKLAGLTGEKIDRLEAQLTAGRQSRSERRAQASAARKAPPQGPIIEDAPYEEKVALIDAYTARRWTEALRAAQLLTETYSRDSFGWKALGTILSDVGRADEAVSALRRAAELAPSEAEIHANLGAAYQEIDQPEQANLSSRHAMVLQPEHADPYANMGVALRKLDRFAEALRIGQYAVRLHPFSGEAHNNLGNAQQQSDRAADAILSYRRALVLIPNYIVAYNNLGVLLREVEGDESAEMLHRWALRIDPLNHQSHNYLGAIQRGLSTLGAADIHFRKAIALQPDYADSYSNLGNIRYGFGKMDIAREACERALILREDFVECLHNLSALKTFTADDPQVAQLRRLAATVSLTSDRIHAHFALAKACEDLKLYDEAFVNFAEGNRLRKQQVGYHIGLHIEAFARVRAAFASVPVVSPLPAGPATPILIVGMPRSGTTLVEQILSSHTEVHGAGELELLNKLISPHLTAGFPPDIGPLCADIGGRYVDDLSSMAQGRLFVTDKMPQNFLWLGFLLAARPDIKVVNLVRDPRAVCWSNFKRYFPARAMAVTSDLSDLAHYYGLYKDLMGFWKERFPGRIYDVDYEALTEDQEGETRKLLAYCGLPWEDSVLEFEKNKRAVRTASASQVRKKIYKGSSEAWRKYAAHLGPLLDGLAAVERSQP